VLSQWTSEQLWGIDAPLPVVIRLAVVSDDESLAPRAVSALERDGLVVRLEVVGRDVSALEALERRPTHVLVRSAADVPGFEHAISRARRLLADAVILAVLTASRDGAGQLLTAGADVLLFDRRLDQALAPAIRAIAAGQMSVPAELRHLIRPPMLSYRERQIIGLAVAGLSNAEIAERLTIAESTVKSHLSAAFRRLGVHSRREAASMVLASDSMLRRTVLGTLRLSGALPSGVEEG